MVGSAAACREQARVPRRPSEGLDAGGEGAASRHPSTSHLDHTLVRRLSVRQSQIERLVRRPVHASDNTAFVSAREEQPIRTPLDTKNRTQFVPGIVPDWLVLPRIEV